jgi:hypothetical protein
MEGRGPKAKAGAERHMARSKQSGSLTSGMINAIRFGKQPGLSFSVFRDIHCAANIKEMLDLPAISDRRAARGCCLWCSGVLQTKSAPHRCGADISL